MSRCFGRNKLWFTTFVPVYYGYFFACIIMINHMCPCKRKLQMLCKSLDVVSKFGLV